ncbi:hypothetical protein TH66_01665 [Carbonactinospora thermoautotrophica]|uniref:Extracellular ligand-binding receptor n=1 Tax=Carbonactinospora thermoautotrophica TaxID=1469144 RepID=A0A132MTT6_9ACTN|nr:ABC transporter substrate-binding protein [Carbonactinospora thermoautotrophica]KWX01261.1 Extracellular ligand-binding receptor [Carbonactinospora thermoautotrophica]KWX05757.1 hypothetical protein TH66_01665 [Carbonactinospora thermoautotrophica]KWX07715.1 hypothetical protein TR74_17830 [Carbonactinospora thermoautotrophica]
MGSIVLTAEQTIQASPQDVFNMFGAGPGHGWVFDAQCDVLAVGAVVTLRVPLLGASNSGSVDILGRIVALRPGRQIVIAHDLPWRGRLRCLFEPDGPCSTRVRLVADLDGQGLEWLLRRHGWPVRDEPTTDSHRVGLLTSKSGPGSVFATASEYLARMAIDEINSDGGIHGRPVELMVADDATDPAVGASEARRLARAGCRAILASVTSATFARAEHALRRAGVLLIHTVLNEGGRGDNWLFRLGERPLNQLTAAVPLMMRETGARRWFLIGNDYSWSHGAHYWGKLVIARHRGVVVGERYTPLGTTNFASLVEEIARSGAELVLSSLVGADEVAFEREFYRAGLRDTCRTLALVLDESTRERIGDPAATGLWTAFGYFQQLPTSANEAFLTRYRRRFGRWAPPVSSLTESVYEAVHLYAAAARAAREDTPPVVAESLRHLSLMVPRGEVSLSGPVDFRQPLFVAEAVPGGYRFLTESPADMLV